MGKNNQQPPHPIAAELGRVQQLQNDAALASRHRHVVELLNGTLGQHYEKATSYTNVIMGAGYAGYFALWALIKDQLSKIEAFATALPMLFSLLVFITWEIYKMLATAWTIRDFAKAAGASLDTYEKALANRSLALIARNKAEMAAWLVVLVLAIVPAIGATATMMWFLVRGLLAAI